ncbi:MAG: tRNA (cytidine(34)-2'-O)-methyltransferase [Proteobacteria bacterium]|nr:tRNA (cytidine(34)-2'-O)-methyltransferase [Pseudomonadota bacterium]
MELALYQPDIPQNTGAMIRTCACLGVPLHIIEPCGFPFSDKGFRRAGLDYLELAEITRHDSWDHFNEWRKGSGKRLVLLTTKAAMPYTDFEFLSGDILLAGRESAGVPDALHKCADASVKIPMQKGARSLNVAVAAAMILGEAVRQMGTK